MQHLQGCKYHAPVHSVGNRCRLMSATLCALSQQPYSDIKSWHAPMRLPDLPLFNMMPCSNYVGFVYFVPGPHLGQVHTYLTYCIRSAGNAALVAICHCHTHHHPLTHFNIACISNARAVTSCPRAAGPAAAKAAELRAANNLPHPRYPATSRILNLRQVAHCKLPRKPLACIGRDGPCDCWCVSCPQPLPAPFPPQQLKLT
jgi:hypothetical protein